jgi:hypothetical protein
MYGYLHNYHHGAELISQDKLVRLKRTCKVNLTTLKRLVSLTRPCLKLLSIEISFCEGITLHFFCFRFIVSLFSPLSLRSYFSNKLSLPRYGQLSCLVIMLAQQTRVRTNAHTVSEASVTSYVLSNDDLSSSDYMASNESMINPLKPKLV